MAANGCIRQGSQSPFRIPARACQSVVFLKQLVGRLRHDLDLVLPTALSTGRRATDHWLSCGGAILVVERVGKGDRVLVQSRYANVMWAGAYRPSQGIGSCGFARTAVQVSNRNDAGAGVPRGETGEICVIGPAVFAGHFNTDEATEGRSQWWFHTGDPGHMDAVGFIYITGRNSDMFIAGGSEIHHANQSRRSSRTR